MDRPHSKQIKGQKITKLSLIDKRPYGLSLNTGKQLRAYKLHVRNQGQAEKKSIRKQQKNIKNHQAVGTTNIQLKQKNKISNSQSKSMNTSLSKLYESMRSRNIKKPRYVPQQQEIFESSQSVDSEPMKQTINSRYNSDDQYLDSILNISRTKIPQTKPQIKQNKTQQSHSYNNKTQYLQNNQNPQNHKISTSQPPTKLYTFIHTRGSIRSIYRKTIKRSKEEHKCTCGRQYTSEKFLYIHVKNKHGGTMPEINDVKLGDMPDSANIDKKPKNKPKHKQKILQINTNWQARLKHLIQSLSLQHPKLLQFIHQAYPAKIPLHIQLQSQKAYIQLISSLKNSTVKYPLLALLTELKKFLICHPELNKIWEYEFCQFPLVSNLFYAWLRFERYGDGDGHGDEHGDGWRSRDQNHQHQYQHQHQHQSTNQVKDSQGDRQRLGWVGNVCKERYEQFVLEAFLLFMEWCYMKDYVQVMVVKGSDK